MSDPLKGYAVKFPNITVQLVGKDGNAFAILGRVRAALKDGGVADNQVEEFIRQATAGTYDQLLATCMKWVEVS
jgi:hypothetical protein